MQKLVAAAAIAVVFATPTDADSGKRKRARTAPVYKLTVITAQMMGPIAINNRGDVMIERQLVQFAEAAPLLLMRRSETEPFQCPDTVNDTVGEALNNNGEMVGHCGHDAKAPGQFAFIANPQTGVFTLLSYPSATRTWTWGNGLNDWGDVVGIYYDGAKFHGFTYNGTTGEYQTLEHPDAAGLGGFTWLWRINNRGQVLGHYNTARNLPWEEFQFLYSEGVFTPIAFPGASNTDVVSLNNNTQVLGLYSGAGCAQSRCVFLWDDDQYFPVALPLPANEPRPDGLPAGNATLTYAGGLNDKAQFVGTYRRVLEWGLDHLRNFTPTRSETVHFLATPK